MFDIRLAQESDCKSMLEIYTPIVEETATSFELELPTIERFRSRVSDILRQYPWLVCTHNSQVAGYAYAGPHRSRQAYQWSVELSVYISQKFHRRGIARALYSALVEILNLQGYYTALAGITLPNDTSVKFHESFGFIPVGIYRNIGYKFDSWHSVGWWEYSIRPYLPSPPEPLHINELKEAEWDVITKRAAQMIKANP